MVLTNQTALMIFFWVFISLAVLAFLVWMLIDMLSSRKLSRMQKGLWFLLFFIGGLVTAIVWAIVRKDNKRRRR